ncbi:putative Late nodulin [Medicago truncatula]|uniref:Nodule Cysteine-Rich (NCR) secreted peptide n=1 Tax=Medicago truncatula TaxID=3880 RepID=A7KH83_MEDTR|nr:nodule-specific cysteine-rich peptide 88 [Medicago truncatula]AES98049.1 Nodule Cysteine-Rich (NCR) secreted peptide [Medicago truncatula]RHN56117.1 putative Late nodulin [Medicago truncatula]
MAKTLNFMFALILFISLFLVSKNVAIDIFVCQTDADCPKSELSMYTWKCIDNECNLFKVMQQMV